MRRAAGGAVVVALLSAWGRPAVAGRPLITDDAGVVGRHAAQVETWGRFDAAASQQWLLVGLGPWSAVELTVGGVHGVVHAAGASGYSVAGPLFQAKLLLREPDVDGLPGLALVSGTFLSVGRGALRPVGHELFGYAASSAVLIGGELLVHGNAGLFRAPPATGTLPVFTWAAAIEAPLVGILRGAAELFSGDPYVVGRQGAGQLCLRLTASPSVQIDATAGTGLCGSQRLSTWGTLGLKLARESLW